MINEVFRARFISTTNPRFTYLIDFVGIGKFANTVFYFDDFRTSYLTKIRQVDNILTLTTRNSEYTFEILDDIVIPDWDIDAKTITDYEQRIREAGF